MVKVAIESRSIIIHHTLVIKVQDKMETVTVYYLAFLLTVMLGYLFWKKVNSTPSKKVVPYKIIKGEKVTEKEKGNKRVCAVVGGTGFVGSHVVNELVKRNESFNRLRFSICCSCFTHTFCVLYLFEDVYVGDGHDCNSMHMLISTYSGHIHTHTHTHTHYHSQIATIFVTVWIHS